jgi:hypothetical protein
MVSTVFVQERVFWVPRERLPFATENIERIAEMKLLPSILPSRDKFLLMTSLFQLKMNL